MDKFVFQERAQGITWFIMDVDGVLTDGGIIYDDQGRELKRFSVKDGLGIRMLGRAGIKTAILTGRSSPMVLKMALELEVTEIVQGLRAKVPAYEALKEKHGFLDEQVLYIGDDYVDLPLLNTVGFPVCVPSASDRVKSRCLYVTETDGGHGAVRETAEMLLELQGKLEGVLARYTGVASE